MVTSTADAKNALRIWWKAREGLVVNYMSLDREQMRAWEAAEWKRGKRRELRSRLIRWGLAIPLFLAVPIPWFGPFMALLGSLLVASDVTEFIVNWLWRPRLRKPKPIYGIPESLAFKGRYEEAEKEYEKIIQQFPDEVKPHVDLINIAVMQLNNAELAEQLYQQGMKLLKDPASRETLTRMYAGIKSRLKSADAESREAIPREKLAEIKERLERDRRKLWR